MERIIGKDYRAYWMGIAMVLVILLHLVYQREEIDPFFRFLRMLFLQGDSGVNIFFFLSSVGLCHSLNGNGVKRFYWRRICRIFPIYVIYLIFVRYLVVTGGGNWYFLMRLTGLNMFAWRELSGDAWYMSALLVLYAIFPLLYFLLQSKFLLRWYSIFFLVCLLTFVYYLPGVHNHFHAMFHARLQVILLGIATYKYLRCGKERDLIKLYGAVAALALFTYNDCAFYFYIPLVLWAFDKGSLPFYGMKFFSFIGRHSLEVYLAQVITLQVLFANSDGNFYTDAIKYLLLTIPVAFALWGIQTGFWQIFKSFNR